MVNSHHLTAIFTMLFFIVYSTKASGSIEIIISSPKTILLEPTVCANFECPAPDELSVARKVQGGVPLRFDTGKYNGQARETIDMHFKITDPITNEIIAIEHHRPLADTEWNDDFPIVIKTSLGFSVTVKLRNHCSINYHGKRCGRFCVPSREQHWECSLKGERRCSVGWSGLVCSIPICLGGCNGRGRCVAPNQCSCAEGFNGTRCEKCLPRPGCLNGDCANDTPNTCKCRDGFIGEWCDIDINICSLQKPCHNGGVCSINPTSSNGYKCECPFDFLGPQCKTPLTSVRCSAEHICKNGGVCISMDDKNIQCKCRSGFTGKFCEIGNHTDCSTLKCSPGSTCHMIGDYPKCVEKETTVPSGIRRKDETGILEVDVKKTKKEEQEMEDLQYRMISAICVLFSVCIVGLIFFTAFFYLHVIAKPNRTLPTITVLPTTVPLSSSSTAVGSQVFKVCIIDSERNNPGNSSDTEMDHGLHRHSPPPAYSSPVLSRIYKSIPTDDEKPSFRV